MGCFKYVGKYHPKNVIENFRQIHFTASLVFFPMRNTFCHFSRCFSTFIKSKKNLSYSMKHTHEVPRDTIFVNGRRKKCDGGQNTKCSYAYLNIFLSFLKTIPHKLFCFSTTVFHFSFTTILIYTERIDSNLWLFNQKEKTVRELRPF